MKPHVRALACTALFCMGIAGAAVAQAQGMSSDDADSDGIMRWEITPFVGYRMGGDFDLSGTTRNQVDLEDHNSFGLAVNLFQDNTASYELFYSRQESSLDSNSPLSPFDLNVEYLHLGGTLLVSEELPLSPYIVGGLGLTRFSPQTGSGTDDTRFSMSLGGGVKLPVTQHFGIRLEARGYVTLVNSESAFFCASGPQGGVCAIKARSDTFIQYELLAGAVFAF
jgi:opacity protein-like surface antigen